MRTLMLLSAFALTIPAQNRGGQGAATSLSGPLLGFVFDEAAHKPVPIAGLPGAALFAEPVDPGLDIVRAESSPAGDSLLGVSAGEGTVVVIQPRVGPAATKAVPHVTPGPDRVVYSPSGSAAAFYYDDTAVIETIRGLPAHPALASIVSVMTLPGPPGSIAISDEGLLLVADANAAGPTLWLFDGTRTPSPVLSVSGAAAAAFLPRSRAALVSDRAAAVLYRIADVRLDRTAAIIAGAGEGLASPRDVAASSDGAYAAVLDKDGRVVSIDLGTLKTAVANCACGPDRIEPLALPGVFAVSAGARKFLLEAGLAHRLLFVPGRASRAGETQ